LECCRRQAAVTHPFSEPKYVPESFRQQYEIAFNKFGFAGDELSKVLFALLVKLRETFLTDEDTVEALTGGRLAEAKRDTAFKAVSAKMLFDDGSYRNGEWSDVQLTFFAKGSYCEWRNITAPSLLIHAPLLLHDARAIFWLRITAEAKQLLEGLRAEIARMAAAAPFNLSPMPHQAGAMTPPCFPLIL
jgi:hypothetical protein